MADRAQGRRIRAIKVHQWLSPWDEVVYSAEQHMARPKPWFLLFSIAASELLPLCGIQPRTTEGALPRVLDLGIQRKHDPQRSQEIREYVQYGYPWSDLSAAKRQSGKYEDLRKPGWLPTSIVVNILGAHDERRGLKVRAEDRVSICQETDDSAVLVLPPRVGSIEGLARFEIIDGQHRLFAFRDWHSGGQEHFDVPVVAFYGLDISWQAYLFWTINVTPKRINPSLAFDLYPLLRQEEWLERFHGHSIYREARAQELTARLWAHPDSPWHQRIDMLGNMGRAHVSQSAWVRALFATFLKLWEGPGVRKIGGLFGARVGQENTVLPWDLDMQSAFLILAWKCLQDAVRASSEPWATSLRTEGMASPTGDCAFSGPHTLLNSEQGVRGVLYAFNDLCYVAADDLGIQHFQVEGVDDAESEQSGSISGASPASTADPLAVRHTSACMRGIEKHQVGEYVRAIANELAEFDWRSADAPSLSEEEKQSKMALRGSGGYALMRRRLLDHLARRDSADVVGEAARDVADRLTARS